MAFDRGDRTYYVSDERAKAFRALSTEEKLRGQEELATFIFLTRAEPPVAPKPDQADHIKPLSA